MAHKNAQNYERLKLRLYKTIILIFKSMLCLLRKKEIVLLRRFSTWLGTHFWKKSRAQRVE